MKRCVRLCAIALAAAGFVVVMIYRGYLSDDEMFTKALVTVVVVGFMIAVIFGKRIRQAETVSGFGGRLSEGERPQCSFLDVAANEEALRSLKELKNYLEKPEKYAKYGARMPKGILLYGPPGTGKTLMARALAGEAGVPFFALSGSDFVEKYVGVGAGRVRDLFKKARKAGKCVIFIDEIDAMGKIRNDQSSDERDQTLNALLSEMSGFNTSDGILVIAATNRFEMLDPALLRPGRFDRQIEIGLPGKKERLSILKLHAMNKPIAENIDLEALAARTTMFSGASLENLMNEAAIKAASRESETVENIDIEKAFYSIVAGEDRECMAGKEEKCVIALHEAGHALVGRLIMPEAQLIRVSILPAGRGAAGYNLMIPRETMIRSKAELENQICVLLAGRAAEVLMGGEEALTSGASGDIMRATELASAMVMELGMGGEPSVSLKTLYAHCGSSGTGAEISKKILEEQYKRAFDILSSNAEALVRITSALVDEESISGDRVSELISDMSNETEKTA